MNIPMTQAEMYLLDYPDIDEMMNLLEDICSVRNNREVVRRIQMEDIMNLSHFVNFPRNKFGSTSKTSGQNTIAALMMKYPQFRRIHADDVCRSIAYYYSKHPPQVQVIPIQSPWINDDDSEQPKINTIRFETKPDTF